MSSLAKVPKNPAWVWNNSLPAARAVWEGADAHLAVYSFSKGQPEGITIHFGGIKGQVIRQRYMDMTYNRVDKDSHVRT